MPTTPNLTLKKAILQECEQFRDCADATLQSLATQGTLLSIPEAQSFPIQTPKGPTIAILQQGVLVELQRSSDNRPEVLTGFVGPNSIAGLVNLPQHSPTAISGPPRNYRTITNVSALVLPATELLSHARHDIQFLTGLLEEANRQNYATGEFLIKSAQTTLEDRLADFFTQIADAASKEDWNPTISLPRIAQTQMATMLGVTREYINRTLNMWEQSGMIFIRKSGEIVIQNRKRLKAFVSHRRTELGHDERLSEIDRLLDHGLHHAAQHIAMEATKRSPKDVQVKHRVVLAMARSGDREQALAMFDSFKLDKVTDNEDIACLQPRIYRDMASHTTKKADRLTFLRKAADGYAETFDAVSGYYSGINAASSFKLLGNDKKTTLYTERVKTVLTELMQDLDIDEREYWPMATQAECALLEGHIEKARVMFQAACQTPDVSAGKRASTRKTLDLLAAATKIDQEFIDDAVPQPETLFFSGPLAGLPGLDTEQQLRNVKTQIETILGHHKIGWAFGALASGSDIVIAESLLEAGVELHIYLPLPPRLFFETSVFISGGDWTERYKSCMRRATRIDWLESPGDPNPALFQHGAHIAMGKAILSAEQLSSKPIGFFAMQQDGTEKTSISVSNYQRWQAAGFEAIGLYDDWPRPAKTKNYAKEEPADQKNITHDLSFVVIRLNASEPIKTPPPAAVSSLFLPDKKMQVFVFAAIPDAISAAQKLLKEETSKGVSYALDAGVIPVADIKAPKEQTIRSFIVSVTQPILEAELIHASDIFVSCSRIITDHEYDFEYAGLGSTKEKIVPCPLYTLNIS